MGPKSRAGGGVWLIRCPVIWWRLGTQPQGGVLGLHGVLDDREQLGVQSVHVRLVAQPGGERFERFGRVVLAAVEEVIDKVLNTPPHGVEQCRYQEGRSHDRQLRSASRERAEGVL